MSELIKNRSEILFLYDVTNANPNGDPIDENKPRIDEETGINIVTDVRLKRTIRDYLHDYKKKEIFVIETKDDKGILETKEERLNKFKSPEDLIDKCIDIRIFGATTAVEGKTMAITGPVQFKYGHSLHKVEPIYVKGTTVMPSKRDRKQGTFTEKYILPYSLIAFYGIVNENAASKQNLNVTEEDILLLLEGIWKGTKNLISCSKFGQMPRLLIQVIYKEENFYIGELDRRISLICDKNSEKEIRDIADVKIDITNLIETLTYNKEKIEKIRFVSNERIIFIQNENETKIIDALNNFNVETLNF